MFATQRLCTSCERCDLNDKSHNVDTAGKRKGQTWVQHHTVPDCHVARAGNHVVVRLRKLKVGEAATQPECVVGLCKELNLKLVRIWIEGVVP